VKFARVGNLEGLKEMSRYMPDVIHKADANGWTVLHESCRAGHLDIVQFLIVEKSIDVDLLTKTGVSPLNIVMEFQGPKHAVTLWLESQGATEIHPHKKKRPIARPKTPSSMPSSSQKSLNSGEL
jgi:ankyrin repeat protein